MLTIRREGQASMKVLLREFGKGLKPAVMPNAQLKAAWPRSPREAHGEAARVQGGAEPACALVCRSALPLPEPWPGHRDRPTLAFIPVYPFYPWLNCFFGGSRWLLNTLQARSTTSLRQDSLGSQ